MNEMIDKVKEAILAIDASCQLSDYHEEDEHIATAIRARFDQIAKEIEG